MDIAKEIERKKQNFISISDKNLASFFLKEYEYLIDDFTEMPTFIAFYLKSELGLTLNSLSCSCVNAEFDNIFKCVDYIKEIRIDNYFYIYNLNYIVSDIIENRDRLISSVLYNTKIEDKIRLRFVKIPLYLDILGKEHIKKQRIRDTKLNVLLDYFSSYI